jgi:hypothetical protein
MVFQRLHFDEYQLSRRHQYGGGQDSQFMEQVLKIGAMGAEFDKYTHSLYSRIAASTMPNVCMGKSRPGIAGRIGMTRVAPKPYWPGLEDDYDFDYDHGVDVTKLQNDEPVIPIANEPLASTAAARVKENLLMLLSWKGLDSKDTQKKQ